MIRFRVSKRDLEAKIDAHDPSWRERARARTLRLEELGCWTDDFADDEDKVGWSEIKSVYRGIQSQKCAYCERRLDSDPDIPTQGSAEHDVEHFRPKSETIEWKKRDLYPDQYVDFDIEVGRADGYYWLAFDVHNWCTSCKRCNSQLKGSRFPLLSTGKPGSPSDEVDTLQRMEQPLLIYPIGEVDEDPETLLEFTGLTVRPVHASGAKRERALGTIAFFLLNAGGLHQSRATWILLVWPKLELEFAGEPGARHAVDQWATSDKVPHAAAVRAFIKLARENSDAAAEIFEEADRLVCGYAV